VSHYKTPKNYYNVDTKTKTHALFKILPNMSRIIILFSIIVALLSCKKQQETFEYTLKGEVIGKDSGKLVYFESQRLGDEIKIPFEKGKFEHSDTAYGIYSSFITFYEDMKSGRFMSFPVIIEPGEIKLEIHADSITYKSRVFSGKRNLKVQRIHNKRLEYVTSLNLRKAKSQARDSLLNLYGDSIYNMIMQNKNNFGGVYLLKKYASAPIFNDKERKELFRSIKDSKLRQLRDFKTVYSEWLGKEKGINKVGTKAHNFSLRDTSGDFVEFNQIAENKMTFVEASGSWCGKPAERSKDLLPIYKSYKDNGFEVITIVQESRYDRWKKWVKKWNFPWVNLAELTKDNTNEVFYGDLLFTQGDNYLVNKQGKVIASDLSPAQLKEQLMKKFEPDKYERYTKNKWKLPEGIHILDKNDSIKSFAELNKNMGENPFIIDCWGTWCKPCLQEFKYNASLKSFLKENDIKIVYIAFERNLDNAQWLDYIKKYELKGYHMRVNEDFAKKFSKLGFKGRLPTYMIVNSEGEIVEPDAHRPSSQEKLYNQIESKLNL